MRTMNPKLKKVFYAWCVLMACLIATLFLNGCGMPNHYNHKDSHYEPYNHIPPAPEIKIKIPKYYYPE